MQPVLDDMLKAVGFDKEGKRNIQSHYPKSNMMNSRKIADVAKYGQDVAGMFSDMFDNITIQDPKGLEGAVKTISFSGSRGISGPV